MTECCFAFPFSHCFIRTNNMSTTLLFIWSTDLFCAVSLKRVFLSRGLLLSALLKYKFYKNGKKNIYSILLQCPLAVCPVKVTTIAFIRYVKSKVLKRIANISIWWCIKNVFAQFRFRLFCEFEGFKLKCQKLRTKIHGWILKQWEGNWSPLFSWS